MQHLIANSTITQLLTMYKASSTPKGYEIIIGIFKFAIMKLKQEANC